VDERKFVILKYLRITPSMAACEACKLKFFVPRELMNDPGEAEGHLRQKYAEHECKRDLGIRTTAR
jgi:hypothetical protein